uniref:Uncharacterized protein n=1 Tax=Panagrolaimus davidi TaxID=227884 RepID=A0A914PZ12_9BILA
MNLLYAIILLFLITKIKANEVPSSNYELLNESASNIANIVYHVCGNKTKYTDCTCINDTIECKPSKNHGYHYWFDNFNPPFTTSNIQILNESFIPKNVIFIDNKIKKLQNDKFLSGHESNVETLHFIINNLKEIENGTFDKFTSLRTLDLSYNFLTNISASVFTKKLGSTLTSLKISYNEFPHFSSIDLSNMEKLEELELISIGVNELYENFIFPKSLSNLKSLDISFNLIQKMNDDIFVNLVNLETLKLYNNELFLLPKSFYSLKNLRHLDLIVSAISSLNKTQLSNFTKLETFNLTHSNLERIEDCTFCDKPNLKNVMLYGNEKLSYIHENAFGNLNNNGIQSLETFSLEFCNLSMIPENLLNWQDLKEFGLGNNPFICNCSMTWLINDILSPTHSINLKSFISEQHQSFSVDYKMQNPEENGFKCFGPLALKNIPFSHISQKLCSNKSNEKPKIIYFKENVSIITVIFVLAACAFTFMLGIFIAPIVRRFYQSKKQDAGFINQNFMDEINVEDFDVEKSFY